MRSIFQDQDIQSIASDKSKVLVLSGVQAIYGEGLIIRNQSVKGSEKPI